MVLFIIVIGYFLDLRLFTFSRYSQITLGEEGEEPEFSLKSWFAMLFSAGMGIGLVFWTTAEPISHAYTATPIHQAGTQAAIDDSLQFAFFIGAFMHGRSTRSLRWRLHISTFIKAILD